MAAESKQAVVVEKANGQTVGYIRQIKLSKGVTHTSVKYASEATRFTAKQAEQLAQKMNKHAQGVYSYQAVSLGTRYSEN